MNIRHIFLVAPFTIASTGCIGTQLRTADIVRGQSGPCKNLKRHKVTPQEVDQRWSDPAKRREMQAGTLIDVVDRCGDFEVNGIASCSGVTDADMRGCAAGWRLETATITNVRQQASIITADGNKDVRMSDAEFSKYLGSPIPSGGRQLISATRRPLCGRFFFSTNLSTGDLNIPIPLITMKASVAPSTPTPRRGPMPYPALLARIAISLSLVGCGVAYQEPPAIPTYDIGQTPTWLEACLHHGEAVSPGTVVQVTTRPSFDLSTLKYTERKIGLEIKPSTLLPPTERIFVGSVIGHLQLEDTNERTRRFLETIPDGLGGELKLDWTAFGPDIWKSTQLTASPMAFKDHKMWVPRRRTDGSLVFRTDAVRDDFDTHNTNGPYTSEALSQTSLPLPERSSGIVGLLEGVVLAAFSGRMSLDVEAVQIVDHTFGSLGCHRATSPIRSQPLSP